jgi:hypothetical protein
MHTTHIFMGGYGEVLVIASREENLHEEPA